MEDEIKERYKLQKAAEIVAQGDIAETNQILHKLEQSIRNGRLQAFRSGSNIHYAFESDKESSKVNESDLIQSDANVPHSDFTWVDRKYDKRLHEALYPLPDNLEAYWDDLNTWLTENEPRLKYKFQNPDTSAKEQTKSQASNLQNAETHQPITNWRMRIQAKAAKIWCEEKKVGCSPTKLSINPKLAKWCRDNNVGF